MSDQNQQPDQSTRVKTNIVTLYSIGAAQLAAEQKITQLNSLYSHIPFFRSRTEALARCCTQAITFQSPHIAPMLFTFEANLNVAKAGFFEPVVVTKFFTSAQPLGGEIRALISPENAELFSTLSQTFDLVDNKGMEEYREDALNILTLVRRKLDLDEPYCPLTAMIHKLEKSTVDEAASYKTEPKEK